MNDSLTKKVKFKSKKKDGKKKVPFNVPNWLKNKQKLYQKTYLRKNNPQLNKLNNFIQRMPFQYLKN